MPVSEIFRFEGGSGGDEYQGGITGKRRGVVFLLVVFRFFLHKRAEPLDTFKWNVVFFHEFFKVVSFFNDEVPVNSSHR